MTAQRLIEHLSTLPPNTKVVVHGKHEWNRGDFIEANCLEIIKAALEDNTYYEDIDGEEKVIHITYKY